MLNIDYSPFQIFTIQEKNIEAAEAVKSVVTLITKTQIGVYDAKDGKQVFKVFLKFVIL